MSFANAALQIKKLKITNFRKFESYSIEFDRQLTVLVGDNGTGKSTLIDAANISLGTLFQKIDIAKAPTIAPDDSHGAVIKQGDMFDVQSQYPVSVEASGLVLGEEVSWLRSLKSAKGRTTQTDAAPIIEAGSRLQKLVTNGNEVVLPVLARYGTDRLWKQALSKDNSAPNRTRGYEDALQASANEARMNGGSDLNRFGSGRISARARCSLRSRWRSRLALMPPRQPRVPWSTSTPSLISLYLHTPL